MKRDILNFLKSTDDFVSGQDISNAFGVTRTAVWKYINMLKDEGYKIESISKKGYRLISSPDVLTPEEIEQYLNTKFIGKNIIHYDSIESTNTKAKQLADMNEADGSVVISEEQTKGRGRLGRSWISPKHKGIWMSIILRPSLDPMDAVKLTQAAAAAVVCASSQLGIETYVKWPNDIVINHKKVCGILTEMNSELTRINYVVVGIGINVNIDEYEFPEDVKSTATSLKIETKTFINRQKLAAGILNNFEKLFSEFVNNDNIEASINICRKHSALLGKEILVMNGEKRAAAKALNIDNEGRLLVEYTDGHKVKLISGEVSIRGTDNYI